MAERKRDLKKEYEMRKNKMKLVGVNVTPEIFEEFTAKCESQNTTKNAIIKQWIEAYIKGDLW